MRRIARVVGLVLTVSSLVAPRSARAEDGSPSRFLLGVPSLERIHYSNKSWHRGSSSSATGPQPDLALVCVGGAMVLVGFVAFGVGLGVGTAGSTEHDGAKERLGGMSLAAGGVLMVGGFVAIFGALLSAQPPAPAPQSNVVAGALVARGDPSIRVPEHAAALTGPTRDSSQSVEVPLVRFRF
jgi:uncharacterized membrane protein